MFFLKLFLKTIKVDILLAENRIPVMLKIVWANAICREYCKVLEGELRAANIPVTVVPMLLPFIF